MENEFKKISSAVPKESDFIDVIVSLKERTPTRCTYVDESTLMDKCADKVPSAERRFSDMLFKVFEEFPSLSRVGQLYASVLNQRFNYFHYVDARTEVMYASMMMIDISETYQTLLAADDCDSLDKCKSLKRAAFACMLAVVRRCVPSLHFLDKVREYMANLDDAGGEHASASAAVNYKHGEGYTVQQLLLHDFAENFEQLVDPQTLVWLEELDRGESQRCEIGPLC
ncbi:unnamed protein product [Eruca vesicaria subsp. sativa]|uniref:NOG1 N-terminal helical domain-containing protein n=1 Tax=Eruca vesicaria subsp. sativa TaxID=29727 RepID=A0ABC8JNF5_ERUVS|nr:unnamed protein product [Eruca vesicaria subsp. sativa]